MGIKLLLVLSLLLAATFAFAQNDDDDPNCKDSTIVSRMPGSKINSCDHKEFEQFSFPLPPDADGNA